MNDKAETISVIVDMLQRANAREVRLVYIFLHSMLNGKGATA